MPYQDGPLRLVDLLQCFVGVALALLGPGGEEAGGERRERRLGGLRQLRLGIVEGARLDGAGRQHEAGKRVADIDRQQPLGERARRVDFAVGNLEEEHPLDQGRVVRVADRARPRNS